MTNINCNLSKNKFNPQCIGKKRLSSSGDAEFRLIIPKTDNSGKPIKKEIVASYIGKMNKIFGGTTTIPTVYGCYRDDKDKTKFQCEKNIMILASRDFNSIFNKYNEKFKNFSNLNKTQRLKQLQEDYIYLRSLAKKASKQLGQEAIFYEQTSVNDAGVIGSKNSKKSTLPISRLAEEVINFEKIND